MAEFNSTKSEYVLNVDDKYYNALDIQGFTQMMKDPSYCYKFYWLEAAVNLISENVTHTTFDAVIDEMIANAWYSVVEFHVHLSGISSDGSVRDGLERAVCKLQELSGLASNMSKIEIKNAISKFNSQIKKEKEQLTNMVPYRALAGFFNNSNEPPEWGSVRRMVSYIEKINSVNILPYTLGEGSKLRREIYFSLPWIEMIQDNTVSILGWIQYEKIKWLQTNNPEVPGLVYKLAPLDEKMRKLSNVRKLWEGVLECHPVTDVFTGKLIETGNYDVDHFIPWSFVMNDELWNLMPMDSSLNSSKSNRLPKWNPFFEKFAENQYLLYGMIYEKEGIHRLFEKCYKDNLHSIWANQELYRKGNSKIEFLNILSKNMQPVYDSAKRQGYEVWNREK
jgi:hypothetical protein